MALKYIVKEGETLRFESDSKLECEMVAIALAFSALYRGLATFKIMQGKLVLDEVDSMSSIQRLREKIQVARFNKRVPEPIGENEIESYIAYNLKKGVESTKIIQKVKAVEDNRRKLRKV